MKIHGDPPPVRKFKRFGEISRILIKHSFGDLVKSLTPFLNVEYMIRKMKRTIGCLPHLVTILRSASGAPWKS
jgi:hypothetical protein